MMRFRYCAERSGALLYVAFLKQLLCFLLMVVCGATISAYAQEAPLDSAHPQAAASIEPDFETMEAAARVAAAALDKIAPSIVKIETIGGAQPVRPRQEGPGSRRGPDFRQGDGPSTGIVWTADGFIITSSFHFLRDPTVITVTLSDERRFVARLIARDVPGRLALLKVDATDLVPVARARVEDVRTGQWVVSAGYGLGTTHPAPSIGIVSATGRMNGMAIQTDAKISPANYGGPLFDLRGRMIGICVPMGMSTDEIAGVEWYDSGIGFVTRVDRIERHFARLSRGENVERGFLGVSLEPEDLKPRPATQPTEPRGLRIGGAPRGPAIAAGLQTGDVILALDDHSTPHLVDLRRALWAAAAGDSIRVRYAREGVLKETVLALVTAESLRSLEEPAPATQPAGPEAPGGG